MGDLLDVEEGQRRMAAYAVPSWIEDWAGPVAGPAEIEKTFGTMADAYYRVTDQPLATFTSVGPGSISIQVAIVNAMFDGWAVLAITGNIPTQQFNRMPFQEIGHPYQADFPKAMRPYVKRSYQATRPDMLPVMMRHAYSTMLAGRAGPVHLDVPLNVFNETTAQTADFSDEWRTNLRQDPAADPETLNTIIEMLLEAERPVIVAGNGALAGRVETDLLALSRMLMIPVAEMAQAKGVIDETDPMNPRPAGSGWSLSREPCHTGVRCASGAGNTVRRPFFRILA